MCLPTATFVCAHGAGGHKDDAAMLRLARALEPAGFEVVRFNFPYREKGSKRIDPMPVLKDAFRNQIENIKGKLILGGRSMGGRVASMLAAEGLECDGLLLAAYPLHPAGAPEKLRDAHLAAIRCPVLCLNGTRDALCRRDLMEAVLKKVTTRWDMRWLEGADHSFRVLKSSGRTDADVDAEVSAAASAWLTGLS
ncbi:MAG TPA: alpha/beta fold hydrolase [Burkholderiales bacterium]|nr:alpha/beta fold hydrolase [Burkholderiales bacterium]